MEELLEERLLNEANFRGKCLGVVWDLIRKLKKIREILFSFIVQNSFQFDFILKNYILNVKNKCS